MGISKGNDPSVWVDVMLREGRGREAGLLGKVVELLEVLTGHLSEDAP